MTWLGNLVCALVDQAAIQSVPVTCSCGRAAESASVAHDKWWTEIATGWQCPGCEAGSISATSLLDEILDEAAILRAHLERVLRILDTGEYRRAEDQAAIVAAREAVR